MAEIALTVFQGRAGDRNDLARPAALAIGRHYGDTLGVVPAIVGTPRAAMNHGWRAEHAAAVPELLTLSSHFQTLMKLGKRPLSATSRCGASLATIPAVAGARPDAVIVWFDAHGDLNTPQTSASGDIGGMALAGPGGLWDSQLGASLDLGNVILFGTRALESAERRVIEERGITVIQPGWSMIKTLEKAVAGRPVYVHLDCDVLKIGTVPCEHEVPGGLSLRDLGKAVKVIAKSEVVGMEIAGIEMPAKGNLELDPLMKTLEPIIAKMKA